MSTLEIDVGDLRASSVAFTPTELVVTLADGRRIATPLEWYPRLMNATPVQRANFEIMAMGIPLITNSGVGDVETIVTRYNSGIVIEDFNEKEFETTTQEIASGKVYDKDGIRKGAREFYSLDSAIEKYTAIYNSILNQ